MKGAILGPPTPHQQVSPPGDPRQQLATPTLSPTPPSSCDNADMYKRKRKWLIGSENVVVDDRAKDGIESKVDSLHKESNSRSICHRTFYALHQESLEPTGIQGMLYIPQACCFVLHCRIIPFRNTSLSEANY